MVNKKVNILILILSIVLLSLVIIIISDAFKSGAALKYNTTSASTVLTNIKNAEIKGDSIILKSEDINGLIEFYSKSLDKFSGFTPGKPYSKLKDGKLYLFLPLKYHMVSLLLNCEGTVDLQEDKIFFTPSSFKAGRIPLSRKFIMNKIKQYGKLTLDSSNERIEISKALIPINIMSIYMHDDILEIKFNKTDQSKVGPQTPSTAAKPSTGKNNNTAAPSSTPENSQTDAEKSVLISAGTQLKSVYSAVKSPKGKQIISNMQNTVNKLILNPSYSYKNDADAILSKYSVLTISEKEELKEAILGNMDFDTLKKLKDTFGL